MNQQYPNHDHAPITATLMALEKRLAALPHYFGRNCIKFENNVFAWMRHLSSEYTGGFWNFYELSNGGFFMAPAQDAITLCCEGNYYEGTMSAEAAGIVVCLYAMSNANFDFPEDLYWNLRDYAADHAEAEEIFAAID